MSNLRLRVEKPNENERLRVEILDDVTNEVLFDQELGPTTISNLAQAIAEVVEYLDENDYYDTSAGTGYTNNFDPKKFNIR